MIYSPETAEGKVKIYLRNNLKIAKKINIANPVSSDQLYQLASDHYRLNIKNIHLYYAGNCLQGERCLTLEDNSIVHIVDLGHLKLEDITVKVKKIG